MYRGSLLHALGDFTPELVGVAVGNAQAWLRCTVDVAFHETLRVQPGVVASHLEMDVHTVGVEDPGGLHGTHMAHERIFCGPTALGVSPVVPFEEVLWAAGMRIEGASGPQNVHVGLASAISGTRIVECPDIGVGRAKGDVQHIAGGIKLSV